MQCFEFLLAKCLKLISVTDYKFEDRTASFDLTRLFCWGDITPINKVVPVEAAGDDGPCL